MLTAQEYASQVMAVVDEQMKAADVFHLHIGRVTVPFAMWNRICQLINCKVKSYGFPYHSAITGKGWTFWNDRAQYHLPSEVRSAILDEQKEGCLIPILHFERRDGLVHNIEAENQKSLLS